MALLLGNEIRVLDSAGTVDTFSGTAQPVYTAPAGKPVVITKLVLRCVSATGVSVPCTAKVEINPAAGDVFTEQELVGVLAVDDMWTFDAEARGLVVPGGSQIDVTVTAIAVGTSQTLQAIVIGYVII